jgi:hypothetical protein
MTRVSEQVNSKLDKQDSKLDKLAVEQGSKLDKLAIEQGEKLDQIITLASNVSKAAGILQAGDQQPASKYATIPPEVPELPAAFQARPALLAELKQRVLSMASSTTSLVGVSRGAAAATTSAHGMGGVGKTTIAVQLIRDPEVGAAFQKLLWVSVSQQLDLLRLLGRLYYQLRSTKLPASAKGGARRGASVEAGGEGCQRAANPGRLLGRKACAASRLRGRGGRVCLRDNDTGSTSRPQNWFNTSFGTRRRMATGVWACILISPIPITSVVIASFVINLIALVVQVDTVRVIARNF